jgi:hypothetical protein
VTEIPPGLLFRPTCPHRYDIAILGDGDWSRRKVFLFPGFITKVDLAVRFQRNLVIGASGHVDRSEVDVNDQLTAGRRINLLTDMFFGRSRGGQS